MPRDSQGLYTLPLPDVVAGTLITTDWANPTMNDLASAMTQSVARDGSGTMSGQLTLPSSPATLPRHATSKAYVDQFMAYATGLPLAAVFPLASSVTLPSAYLLCDGQAVSRTVYADLFAAIGATYGPGDGSTTFNVPDLRDWFIRGKADSRPVGGTQQDSFRSHSHQVVDAQHTHTFSGVAHTHVQGAHTHTIDGVGDHTHTVPQGLADAAAGGQEPTMSWALSGVVTGSAGAHTHTAQAAQPAVEASIATGSNAGSFTGITTTQVFGGGETTPKNVAMNYWIKAQNDAVAPVTNILGITSSDDEVISIDNSNTLYPNLDIHSNVALGLAKLDAAGKIPSSLLPASTQSFLGVFDCSSGNNPSQAFPATTFLNGDTYLVSVAGTIAAYDASLPPFPPTPPNTFCNIGDNLVYFTGTADPDGWYRLEAATIVTASQVSFIPTGDVSATNVQDAIDEVSVDSVSNAIAYSIALG